MKSGTLSLSYTLVGFLFSAALALGGCTAKFPLLKLNCGVKARALNSSSSVRIQASPQKSDCTVPPKCFYDVYSSEPVSPPAIEVRGFVFQPSVELMTSEVPESISPQSHLEEARCYDVQNKSWVSGEPEQVLQKLNCI